MHKDLELWQFIAGHLKRREAVTLLVVAASSGSSPGRAGYKMAVGSDDELFGSIGGGVMEVSLVERARAVLSVPPAVAGSLSSVLIEQEHRKNAEHPSGMICSGQQTVIMRLLTADDEKTVDSIIPAIDGDEPASLTITPVEFSVGPPEDGTPNTVFKKRSETEFQYVEKLGVGNDLYIIGGGHCALALSEIMSRLDFRISIFDDRPELNTIGKNHCAHTITIVDGYDRIGEMIAGGDNGYVVVMTLGYKFDEIVIRTLLDRDFRYFGVLGSRAKMATLFRTLKNDGFPADRLARIRTPIGVPINSHSPEEIAVSIAAEIISVKNSA